MKKLLGIVVLGLLLCGNAYASEFCDGFEDGYQKGHRTISGFAGFSPFCPFQPFRSFDDPSDDYGHGFNVGLKEGCDGDSFCFDRNKK